MADTQRPLRILSLSVHGLVRAEAIELGRDADTGGQVLYVIDQARALARQPDVAGVKLLTRRIQSKRLDPGYAEPVEPIVDGATIVRIPCGPRRYLRKERLWPYLDAFVDHAVSHIRSTVAPDVVHAHYADAGYVGAQIAKLLGVPLVFTGHSLGRVKRERLLARGADAARIEKQYNLRQRIEAEERALENATLVIASTRQEVREQYEMYEHYAPERMEVIPPGVDLSRFHPPAAGEPVPEIAAELGRFLREPKKPMVLAIARPDERKNLATLVRAYGESAELRERANLVVLAGTRDDILEQPAGARRVLNDLLLLIDRLDLYGSVAYPKHHRADDVPRLYRYAARLGSVFVNPALTEPFGLTLIEAAASGLPIVATEQGGPVDIVEACRNGILVDPLDAGAIATALLDILRDRARWEQYARAGIEGSRRAYTWDGHAKRYVACVRDMLKGSRRDVPAPRPRPRHIARIDRMLVTDVDNTLAGDAAALRAFVRELAAARDEVGFAIATGRSLASAVQLLEEEGVPWPDVLITSVGTDIHYGRELTPDRSWERHIDYRWRPDALRAVLDRVPGLELQDEAEQARFKVSYGYDGRKAPPLARLRRVLREARIHVKLVLSHGMFLDVIPINASPGQAIRFLGFKWNLPPERFLVAGDAGNDEEMLRGNTLGVVVGNYSPELEVLRGQPRVYFAKGTHAHAILEGIEHYSFFDDVRIPTEEDAGEDVAEDVEEGVAPS